MSPSDPTAAGFVAPATEARNGANHYNGFKVGALGYGGGRIFEGANTKPTADAAPDCAEMKIMRAAAEAGVILDGMVVVGQPRKEDTTPTLHCCGERCRPLMRGYIREGKVLRPDTRITCVNVLTSAVEEFTVESMHAAHGESLDD